MASSQEQRLMDLLGFDTREQLIDFLNSPDRPTGNMVPAGQIQRDMQILVDGKEEIHRLFMSLDGDRQADAIAGDSKSAAEAFNELPNEHPMRRAAQAAWEDLFGKTRELSGAAVPVIIANESIIKPEAVEADRRTLGFGESEPVVAQGSASDISDEALIAMYERSHSGIRAICRLLWETTTGVLGLALGWNVLRNGATFSQHQTDTSGLSVRWTWPLLAGAGIVTAWLFSPFNASPALVLMALSIQFGFNHLKKRSSPIFLKSALLFLILFVPTGMIHDAFFDHPTAICSDGWYSYSASKSGTCSGHSGVSRWHPERKHWWQLGSWYSSSGVPNYPSRGRKGRFYL